MKRSKRIASILKILTDAPNTPFSLQYFCDLFGTAKSTISEDIKEASNALQEIGTGYLETISGKKGGVKFVPDISNEDIKILQEEFCSRLRNPNRLLGGNFIYTSDIFYDPNLVSKLARVFAVKFKNSGANIIVTLETKGIPLAFKVAQDMGLPLAVIRREPKISEGSTVSINYFSGSLERLEKMTMSKRALPLNSKVLIIDDFMRAGGSVLGIIEMIKEFDSEVVGIGVAIAGESKEKRKVTDYLSIANLGKISTEEKIIEVSPNTKICN